jgi:hypothetical protein
LSARDRVVLHVSPHPDDELIGAPATLMALRDAGFRIVNLALGLGHQDDRERRRAELERASATAGFELVVADPPVALSADSTDASTGEAARGWVGRTLDELAPELVVSPWAGDSHPSHELAGRVVEEALRLRGEPAVWWAWGLWAALPAPTLYVPFDAGRLDEIGAALGEYAGELERNDYRRLVEARAAANAILGAELVFGFGSRGRGARYAELIAEGVLRDGRWLPGRRRELDPAEPFS